MGLVCSGVLPGGTFSTLTGGTTADRDNASPSSPEAQVGAGTMNPSTFLRVLGPEPWSVAYVEPSIRPDDSRYGLNPNRVQRHTQFQVRGPGMLGWQMDMAHCLMGLRGVQSGGDDGGCDADA